MRGFLVLVSLWSAIANASTILFQSASSSPIEYRASLKAGRGLTSPVQKYLSLHPESAMRDQLLARYAEAQKAFVSHSPEEATHLFETVTELATRDDWSPTERAMIVYAQLRLAQLANEPDKRDAWLAKALLMGNEIQVDKTLFPPPMLTRLEELRRQAPKVNPGETMDADWSKVLINGIPCTHLDCPTFPDLPVPVRMTLLSDRWQTQVVVGPLNTLRSTTIPKQAWVTGSCGHAVFAPGAQALGTEPKGFFGLACENASTLNLTPTSTLPIQAKEAQLPAMPDKPSQPFYRNKWVWVGIGAAVLTAVVIASQPKSRNSEPEPTTTYGY